MLEKKIDDLNYLLSHYFYYNYLKNIEDTKDDIVISFSALPSGHILSMLWKLGINLKELGGKNVMSVGEGIPFLVGSLSKMGANVIAVDPLYEKGPGYIYDSLKDLVLENENALKIALSELDNTNIPVIKQMNRMKRVIDGGKEEFCDKFFNNNVQFNSSFADNIHGVDNYSQDFIILSFLLNNINQEEDIGFVLGEVLNKLKKGGNIIIIGPDGITKSYVTKYHIENLKQKYKNYKSYKSYNYNDNNEEYMAFSFVK